MARPRFSTMLAFTAAGALGVGASLLGYHLIRADVAESVYRQRLEDIAGRYESLREQYNEAVRRTAVTELLVRDGRLSVRICNAAGVVKEIPTDFNPAGEIYVDYAIVDGRLWIRRVFDAQTPPARGLLVDPSLANIDWDGGSATFGKAVYRSLGEGRWVVSASGDGSLELRQAGKEPAVLSPPPRLGTFDEIDSELRRRLDDIGPGDVWKQFWGT
ncbi:MAG: hypothetical protein KJZ65_07035 [Phycisphaerales bacterium]|nr:hypothetical protein [Phycisphaerales bacterium]